MARGRGFVSSGIGYLLVCFCALLTGVSARSQSQSVVPALNPQTRVSGPGDSDVPIPPGTLESGRRDPTALQVLADFAAACNFAGFTAMQGTGTFIDHFSSNPATLTVTNTNGLRLDIADPSGPRSMRVLGAAGGIEDANGKRHSLPMETASGGFWVTPLSLVSRYVLADTSIVDQGIVQIGGRGLHRVTVAYPAIEPSDANPSPPVSVVDLYLDPTSRLLVKSAGAIQLDSRDRSRYMQVVTYGDYRPVAGAMTPFSYSVTLNGQEQWSLQIANATANPTTTPSFFLF